MKEYIFQGWRRLVRYNTLHIQIESISVAFSKDSLVPLRSHQASWLPHKPVVSFFYIRTLHLPIPKHKESAVTFYS